MALKCGTWAGDAVEKVTKGQKSRRDNLSGGGTTPLCPEQGGDARRDERRRKTGWIPAWPSGGRRNKTETRPKQQPLKKSTSGSWPRSSVSGSSVVSSGPT
jgi:hypothetical protein